MSDNWSAVDAWTLIRAWQPGDGLACTQGKRTNRIPCGEPVAVVKSLINNGCRVGTPDQVMSAYRGGHESSDITITRVVCLRHMATLFDSNLGLTGDKDVEKRALEELAQRYWDQYSEIKTRLIDELTEARFSVLPAELRSKVIELIRESGDVA